MIKRLCFVLLLLPSPSYADWQLVYSHDKTGKVIQGEKQKLINFVKKGHPVRIVWPIRDNFMHMMDAGFITLMNGEVFAQVNSIIRQIPDKETRQFILLDAEKQSEWHAILSTTGEIRHFQTLNKKLNRSHFALEWYVDY